MERTLVKFGIRKDPWVGIWVFFLVFLGMHIRGISQDLGTVTDGISEKEVDRFKLKREFANIATGNTFSTIGNFASVSTKSETLSASLILISDNGNVWGIELSGGATQGVATLFDDGDLNTNVSIGGSYNILLRKSKNAIVTNSTSEDALKLEIAAENREYQKKLLDHLEGKYSKDLDLDISRLNSLIKQLENDNNELEKTKAKAMADRWEKSKLDSLHLLILANTYKIDEANSLLQRLIARKSAVVPINQYEIINALEAEHYSKVKALKTKIYELKPDAVSFSWISAGMKFKNNSFKLFDAETDLDKQISSEEYNSFSFTLSYNHLSNVRILDNRGSGQINANRVENKTKEYISMGVRFDYTDNLSSLQQVEISDTEVMDTDSGRTKTVKQNAFAGEYEKDLDNLTLFVDYYNFLSTNDKVAIHLSPSVLMREKFKPVSGIQVGMLLPFKNKDKQNTFLNLEFFYKMKDIFNTSESDNSLLNRNSIGVQASFPFN